MSNCPKCGYPIAPDETACTNCGEPVENTKEENVSPENVEEVEKEEVEVEESQEIDDVSDTLEPEEAEDIVDEEETLDSKEELKEESENVPEVETSSEEKDSIAEETTDVIKESETSDIEEPSEMAQALSDSVELAVEPAVPVAEEMLPGVADTPIENIQLPVTPVVPETVEMPEIPQNTPMMPVAPSTVEIPVVMPQEVPMTPMGVPNMVTPEAPVVPMAPDMSMMSPELGMMPSADNGILMQPEPISMPDVPSVPMPVEPTADLNVEAKTSSKAPIFNKVMFFLVFIISIVAIALLSFFMMKVFSKDNTVQGTKVSETAREYHYEGFNFYIPEKDEKKDDLHAEIYDGEFYIGTNVWSAVLTLQSGTYNSLLSNKSQLVDYFKDMGYEPTEPTEKEISGVSFVKMEVVMGSKNVLVAYAKANGTKLYGIILENETGEYTDDDLKTIGTLLATAKYVGPKFSLPEGLQLDKFKETFMVAE